MLHVLLYAALKANAKKLDVNTTNWTLAASSSVQIKFVKAGAVDLESKVYYLLKSLSYIKIY